MGYFKEFDTSVDATDSYITFPPIPGDASTDGSSATWDLQYNSGSGWTSRGEYRYLPMQTVEKKTIDDAMASLRSTYGDGCEFRFYMNLSTQYNGYAEIRPFGDQIPAEIGENDLAQVDTAQYISKLEIIDAEPGSAYEVTVVAGGGAGGRFSVGYHSKNAFGIGKNEGVWYIAAGGGGGAGGCVTYKGTASAPEGEDKGKIVLAAFVGWGARSLETFTVVNKPNIKTTGYVGFTGFKELPNLLWDPAPRSLSLSYNADRNGKTYDTDVANVHGFPTYLWDLTSAAVSPAAVKEIYDPSGDYRHLKCLVTGGQCGYYAEENGSRVGKGGKGGVYVYMGSDCEAWIGGPGGGVLPGYATHDPGNKDATNAYGGVKDGSEYGFICGGGWNAYHGSTEADYEVFDGALRGKGVDTRGNPGVYPGAGGGAAAISQRFYNAVDVKGSGNTSPSSSGEYGIYHFDFSNETVSEYVSTGGTVRDEERGSFGKTTAGRHGAGGASYAPAYGDIRPNDGFQIYNTSDPWGDGEHNVLRQSGGDGGDGIVIVRYVHVQYQEGDD